MVKATEIRTCKKHGEYTAEVAELPWLGTMGTSCPSCKADEAKEAAEKADAALISSKESCGLARRLRGMTFASWDETRGTSFQAVNYAGGLPREDGRGLVIAGPPGTGKTHLAAAICNQAFDRKAYPLFISVPAMLLHLQPDQDARKALMERLCTVPLLCLDDLGKEKPTEWAVAQVFHVVNTRYMAMLPVIVTTNFSGKALEDRIGEATVDRLIETCEVVTLDGESYRLRALQGGRA